MDLAFWRDLAIFIVSLIFILFTLVLCFVLFVSAFALRKAEKGLDEKLKSLNERVQSVRNSSRKLAVPVSRPFITLVAFKEGAKEFFRFLLGTKKEL